MIKPMCLILLALLLQASEAGCRPEPPSQCKEFFALPMDQRETKFRTLSLDEQLTVYRCGMKRRPPTISLGYQIADGGEKIIPHLMEELRNEKDEWLQAALIDIFRVMSSDGHLRGRTDVVKEIKDTVSRMKITGIRKEAEESLRTVEKNVYSN